MAYTGGLGLLSRNSALKELKGEKLFVALMGYWFINLECSQRDFGQLINDSFFGHFTQTHQCKNTLEMNLGRVSAVLQTVRDVPRKSIKLGRL